MQPFSFFSFSEYQKTDAVGDDIAGSSTNEKENSGTRKLICMGHLIRVTVKDPVTGEERSASYPVTVSASGGSAVLPLTVAAAAVLAAGGTVALLLLKKKKAGSAS